MDGYVFVTFCIPSVMQSLLFSNKDGISHLYIVTSIQILVLYKLLLNNKKYVHSSVRLPSNRFPCCFFYILTTLRCYGN